MEIRWRGDRAKKQKKRQRDCTRRRPRQDVGVSEESGEDEQVEEIARRRARERAGGRGRVGVCHISRRIRLMNNTRQGCAYSGLRPRCPSLNP